MSYRSLKTRSRTTYFPPGFNPPVSRFCTLASFWSEMVTHQIWHETVKTGGLGSKMSFPLLAHAQLRIPSFRCIGAPVQRINDSSVHLRSTVATMSECSTPIVRERNRLPYRGANKWYNRRSVVEDPSRRAFLQQVYDLLLLKEDSSYSRFILMHFRGERPPFLYEIFSSPLYRGVECALWPALYHTTSLCESILEGQDNCASGKIAFMHKLLSPVHDFSIHFEILQYQYD